MCEAAWCAEDMEKKIIDNAAIRQGQTEVMFHREKDGSICLVVR